MRLLFVFYFSGFLRLKLFSCALLESQKEVEQELAMKRGWAETQLHRHGHIFQKAFIEKCEEIGSEPRIVAELATLAVRH